MTIAPAPTSPPEPRRTASKHHRRRRRTGVRRLLKTSAIFLLGLIACLALAEWFIGRQIRRTMARGMLGGVDVYLAKRQAKRDAPHAQAILIGDSVARQLFMPAKEPNDRVRYVASNQAISMAGQYYMLEETLPHCPAATDVYLVYYPGSFGNGLPKDLTHDYYCGYFHRPSQVIETFKVTHDTSLLVAHVGRMLLPNLMAANSARHIADGTRDSFGKALDQQPAPKPDAGFAQLPADREVVLDLASAIVPPVKPIPDRAWAPPPGLQPVQVSHVSWYYLAKMRTLCEQKGLTLHVLPAPCSDIVTWYDGDHVYDQPIVYFDRAQFHDAMHFEKPFIDTARERIAREYGFERLLTGPTSRSSSGPAPD
jgi:hypothetical protein